MFSPRLAPLARRWIGGPHAVPAPRLASGCYIFVTIRNWFVPLVSLALRGVCRESPVSAPDAMSSTLEPSIRDGGRFAEAQHLIVIPARRNVHAIGLSSRGVRWWFRPEPLGSIAEQRGVHA